MYDDEVEVYVDPDIEDLIPMFLENRRGDVEKIKGLLKEGDFEEIRRLGHSMKGAGGGYGFDEITEIGRKIEEAAKSKDKVKVEKLNMMLAEYLSVVKVVTRHDE